MHKVEGRLGAEVRNRMRMGVRIGAGGAKLPSVHEFHHLLCRTWINLQVTQIQAQSWVI